MSNDRRVVFLETEPFVRDIARFFDEHNIPHDIYTDDFSQNPSKNTELGQKLHDKFPGRLLAVGGSGKYHYITRGLVEDFPPYVGYIHNDGHDDFNDSETPDTDTCHGFVRKIKREKMFCGTTTPIQGNSIRKGKKRVIGCMLHHEYDWEHDDNLALRYIDTMPESVYVTSDMDLLFPDLFKCGFSCGSTFFHTYLEFLDIVLKRKNVKGADIFGYDEESGLKERFVYAMTALTLMGRDIESLKAECDERIETSLF